MEFTLDGEKLHGRWHLVRMHGKAGAAVEGEDDLLDERPESVKTGRDSEDGAGEEPGWSSKTGRIRKSSRKAKERKQEEATVEAPDPSGIKGALKAKLPDFLPSTLATLATSPLAGKRWLHEIKFDGYRLQARIEAAHLKLLTRSGLDWTRKFGRALVSALAALPVGTALIDGELVVETGSGASDFSALQADLSTGRDDRFTFYLFDLFHLDGYGLTRLPLEARKTLLEKRAPGMQGILRYSGHFDENGALVLRHACCLSPEGVVFKLRDTPYREGLQQELDQVKMPGPAGIRHRRLLAIHRLAPGHRLARARRLQERQARTRRPCRHRLFRPRRRRSVQAPLAHAH
jgi:bifunctional non-homologous end joining protein LigD